MQAPDRKVGVGALGGAIAAIVVWIMTANGIEVPADVAVAITSVLVFILQYFVPNAPGQAATLRSPFIVTLLAVVLVAVSTGCTTTPHRAPATVYEGLLIADKYGEQLTRTVNDLRIAGVITKAQHNDALDHLQEALDTSRAARTAYQAADWEAAVTGLDRTESVLRLLSVMLEQVLPDTPANDAFLARYGVTP